MTLNSYLLISVLFLILVSTNMPDTLLPDPDARITHYNLRYHYLHQGWQFKSAKNLTWLSATVPSTVHMDLMDHKLIPDPFLRD